MSYAVKEIVYTIQGEGANTGRPAVFLRFSGCNLACPWCDTDFKGTDGFGGGRYENARILADRVLMSWENGAWMEMHQCDSWANRFVVVTGGEPMLQLDMELILALGDHGFTIALETNGTIEVPDYLLGNHWVTVSPKAGTEVIQKRGHELKLVYPQPGLLPGDLDKDEWSFFEHWFLQPMDGPDIKTNTEEAIHVCLRNPRWRLSVQLQKTLRIP